MLLNGKVFTSDASHHYVQALAIRGERIVATGDSATIEALAGPQTRQIDLGGRTVIPASTTHTTTSASILRALCIWIWARKIPRGSS